MPDPKPLFWVASSRRDLVALPAEVQDVFGFALHLAQVGNRHADAKALQGFGGAGVLEVVEDHRGDTFRAVYTVKFAGFVYVLHAFQKKSKRGAKTPQADLDLIASRLALAEADYKRRKEGQS